MAPAIPFENLILFFGASLLLAMSPGPDNIFVLTQSLLHGKKAGLLVTAGLCTGLLGHTAAATAGVSALLQASPVAFKVLKMFGASYLLYLAWQALSSANKPPGTQHGKPSILNGWQLYSRGILMNISNPKVAIFFLAFFPQFAKIEFGDIALQMIVLGCFFILATAICFSFVALAAGTLGEKLSSSQSVHIWLNRIASLVFIGLAAKLVID